MEALVEVKKSFSFGQKAASYQFLGQDQSPFFSKLPPELRIKIYRYAFQHASVIHISCLNRRASRLHKQKNHWDDGLVHVPCKTKCNPAEWQPDTFGSIELKWGVDHVRCMSLLPKSDREGRRPNVLKRPKPTRAWLPAMLLTCRRMYDEVHHEVYSTVTFSLNGDDLEAAHRFLGNIGPRGQSALKSINIHLNAKWPMYLTGNECNYRGAQLDPSQEEKKWQNICRILSTCCTLQSLYVKIYDRGFILPEIKLLEPLQNLKIHNFVVQLPWNYNVQTESDILRARFLRLRQYMIEEYEEDDYNFKLLRPGMDSMEVIVNSNNWRSRRRPNMPVRNILVGVICVMVLPVIFVIEGGRQVKKVGVRQVKKAYRKCRNRSR